MSAKTPPFLQKFYVRSIKVLFSIFELAWDLLEEASDLDNPEAMYDLDTAKMLTHQVNKDNLPHIINEESRNYLITKRCQPSASNKHTVDTIHTGHEP